MEKISKRGDAGLSIGYFGAQGTHAQSLLKLIDPGIKRYVDLTAGGMGMPYQICLEKLIPVSVNDIGYFSHVCGKAVFTNSFKTYNWDEILNPMELCPGMISKIDSYDWLSVSFKLRLPEKCKNYLDTLCAKNQENYILLASIGKFLLGDMTFRGLSFCNTTNEKRQISSFTIEDLQLVIKKYIQYFERKRDQLPIELREQNIVSWNNASNFVTTQDFNGALVYMDPAWPWNNTSADNPYFLSSVIIPTILMQSDAPEKMISFEPWVYGGKEIILKDIFHWVNSALRGGAYRVIVNTQSTNYPDPINEVEPFLKKHFEIETYLDWKVNSALATLNKNSFGEFAWIIKKINI